MIKLRRVWRRTPAKNEGCPMSQKVIVMKERVISEPHEKLSSEDNTVALYSEKESKAEIKEGMKTV